MNSVGLGGSWSEADALISKAPHPAPAPRPFKDLVGMQGAIQMAPEAQIHIDDAHVALGRQCGARRSWSEADALISKAPQPTVCCRMSDCKQQVQHVPETADLCLVHKKRQAWRLTRSS